MRRRPQAPDVESEAAIIAATARALLALQPTTPECLPQSTGRGLTPAVRMHAQELTLPGWRFSYRTAGSGPPVVLLHGIASSSITWQQVVPWLAQDYTLIAPDILGQRAVATPRGGSALDAYAEAVRALLASLGHDRATVVGHSLGGGVAMHFADLFPECCERLVLVSSGGLGREVHYALRAGALPGAEWVLPLLASRASLRLGQAVGGLLARLRSQPGGALQELARGVASLDTADTRQEFLHQLRAVVEPGGQRVSADARPRLAGTPTLIVWGAHDQIIPRSQGVAAFEALPGSRLVVFKKAGHFPHSSDPRGFAAVLNEFHASTEAVPLPRERWRPRIEDASEGARL